MFSCLDSTLFGEPSWKDPIRPRGTRFENAPGMKLREHPALCSFGTSSWPPVWLESGTEGSKRLIGEVGTLAGTIYHDQTPKRLFLRIDFQGQSYLGCLISADWELCRNLHILLESHIGEPIQQIGNLELSFAS